MYALYAARECGYHTDISVCYEEGRYWVVIMSRRVAGDI